MDDGFSAPTRKRKSNFDVPPEAMKGSPAIDIQSIIARLMNGQQLGGASNQVGLASEDPLVPWTPATDAAFTLRLQRAMQRNFEYLTRYLGKLCGAIVVLGVVVVE